MSVKSYPEKITVDVHARLHLEHTDLSPEEHRIVDVEGQIESYPNEGNYSVVLRPQENIRFSAITSGPCVVLVIIFILDWPTPANSHIAKIREERGLEPPQNFLDLSDGEYDANVRLNFEDGYAYKHVQMRKINDSHYECFLDTVHRYPSSKSKGLERILPHDITLVDGGAGKLFGSTQARWLKDDGNILTGDITMEVDLVNQESRIPFTEVFSYEYNHSSFDEYPFRIDATGVMKAVDTYPENASFNNERRSS